MRSTRWMTGLVNGSLAAMLVLGLLAGCAGTLAAPERTADFVQITNPGFTMSPGAPETIWVPRSYLERGVPRGKDLARRGYQTVTGEPSAAVAPDALVDPSGKPAALVRHFGLVVEQDGDRVYFNLGLDDGLAQGQQLLIYRGGTIVQGVGLAPGAAVGTLEVLGFVGRKGAFGVFRQGGPARPNDLIACQ